MPRWSAFVPEIDRGLVRGLNDGEENALARLYDLYVEQMFDYAVSLVGEGRAAEVLVHDVFIDAARRGPRLRDRGRFRAWLYAAVRRRGMERSRTRGPAWEWDLPGVGDFGGLSVDEGRRVLEGALDRMSLSDQDLLLLTFRHGVVAADLAAVLGVSPFKAAALVGRARSRGEAALEAQLRAREKRCQRERGEKPQEGHRRGCAECRRRAGVSLPLLLEAPPAPVPPPGLRHRVLHTGTDPELAGYRADIAGKGGNLTPEGMPRQPDVPSPLGRRWLLAGSGMTGTFVVALVTTFLIGPNLGWPGLTWPPLPGGETEQPVVTKPTVPYEAPVRPRHEGPPGVPDVTHMSTSSPPSQVENDFPAPEITQYGTPTPMGSPEPSSSVTPPQQPQPVPNPSEEGHAEPPPSPSPSEQKPQAPIIMVAPTEIRVDTPLVEIGANRSAEIRFQAFNGPVTWQAATDSGKITLDAENGVLPEGQTEALRVRLPLSIVRLAGSAVVSITNVDNGAQSQVTVRWGLGLL
ncbi:RNA polymerase sigma factor [Actinocorallia libanotica]|uniref:RNA polymerase sigma-70 region 2 domain-containing protein n=1 Tax=Actinocorallia libanotica TaxID=46162 RepID=A0ABP4BEX2_9ACTN